MVIGVDARSNVITPKLVRVATNIPSSEGSAHRNLTTEVTARMTGDCNVMLTLASKRPI